MVFGEALRTLAVTWVRALATASGAMGTLIFVTILSPTTTFAAGPPLASTLLARQSASLDAHQALQWVLDHRDHQGRPFAIVDKKEARIFVFDAQARLAGVTPALLGLAPGDHAIPGVGRKKLSDILPFERTTPAGRFASEPGRNLNGEAVVWIDYDAGLAIHRLRPVAASQRRPERLGSVTPDDNRISLGCVIVSVDFYQHIIAPTLGAQPGVVYVLPETLPVEAMLDAGPVDPASLTAS